MLDQLRAAAEIADKDTLEELIGQVSKIDKGLAQGLMDLVNKYAYEEFSRLLGKQ